MSWIDGLKFDSAGLVPVVAQDVSSGAVLMVAYADRDALRLTAESGRAHYWSRSRREIWEKGATSGNTQQVLEVRADCDGDAVLYRVHQNGPACHTGEGSCFHRAVIEGNLEPASTAAHILSRVEAIVAARAAAPEEGSYTSYLLDRGIDKVLKKVGEEATEIVIAAKNGEGAGLDAEVADLLFHLLVLLRLRDVPLHAIWEEMERRFGQVPRLPRETPATHTHS